MNEMKRPPNPGQEPTILASHPRSTFLLPCCWPGLSNGRSALRESRSANMTVRACASSVRRSFPSIRSEATSPAWSPPAKTPPPLPWPSPLPRREESGSRTAGGGGGDWYGWFPPSISPPSSPVFGLQLSMLPLFPQHLVSVPSPAVTLASGSFRFLILLFNSNLYLELLSGSPDAG